MVIKTGLLLFTTSTLLVLTSQEPISWAATPGRNMVSSATNLPEYLSEDNLLWEITGRGSYNHYSTPTIYAGHVYFGASARLFQCPVFEQVDRNEGSFHCLDQWTGEAIWEYPGEPAPFGTMSSLVPDGDRLYAVNAQGTLLCFDAKGMQDGNDGPFLDESADIGGAPVTKHLGDVIWKVRVQELFPAITLDHGYAGTPLLLGDQIWITSNHAIGTHQLQRPCSLYHKEHGPEPGHPDCKHTYQNIDQFYHNYTTDKPDDQKPPFILVFDKQTGRLLAHDDGQVDIIRHGQWTTLASGRFGDEDLVVFADGGGKLHGFAIPDNQQLDGSKPYLLQRRWKVDCVPDSYKFHPDGTPKIYLTHDQGRKWSDEPLPQELIATPVIVDERIYIAIGRDYMYGFSPGMLWCFKPDGEGGIAVAWQTDAVATTMVNAAVHDGLVYIADQPGRLHCLEAQTGETVWVQDISGGNPRHHSVYSSPWVADGKVYVGTAKHYLCIMRAGREQELLFYDRIPRETTTVATADGILVIPTRRGAIAYGPGRPDNQLARNDPLSAFDDDSVLRINCAGSEDYIDTEGKRWRADQIFIDRRFGKPTWGHVGGRGAKREQQTVANTAAPMIYLTERYVPEHYKIPVPNGPCEVRLHFAETFEGSDVPGKRRFDVIIEEETILNDFDPFAAAQGRKFVPVIRRIPVTISDEELTITFQAQADSTEPPMINAIEVILPEPIR
jgi:outer membrane protein assembly factor BamB